MSILTFVFLILRCKELKDILRFFFLSYFLTLGVWVHVQEMVTWFLLGNHPTGDKKPRGSLTQEPGGLPQRPREVAVAQNLGFGRNRQKRNKNGKVSTPSLNFWSRFHCTVML